MWVAPVSLLWLLSVGLLLPTPAGVVLVHCTSCSSSQRSSADQGPLSCLIPLPPGLGDTLGRMSAMQKGALLARGLFSWQHLAQLQHSGMHSKPPKGKVGPAETVVGLSVFALALLTPAGWIMHHLPEYRRK